MKVLDEELCQKYLLQATNNGNVKVMPEILCVADTFPWKVAVWENKGGQFKKVTGSKSKEYLKKYHYGAKYAPEGYVASAGTCRGDSGGPLYITENNLSTSNKSYIVLGRYHSLTAFASLNVQVLLVETEENLGIVEASIILFTMSGM